MATIEHADLTIDKNRVGRGSVQDDASLLLSTASPSLERRATIHKYRLPSYILQKATLKQHL